MFILGHERQDGFERQRRDPVSISIISSSMNQVQKGRRARYVLRIGGGVSKPGCEALGIKH